MVFSIKLQNAAQNFEKAILERRTSPVDDPDPHFDPSPPFDPGPGCALPIGNLKLNNFIDFFKN